MANKPPKTLQTWIPAEKTKNQRKPVDIKPLVVVAKTGTESKIPVKSPPPAKTAKSTVEKVKHPPENSGKINQSPLSKKAAKPPEVPKPVKSEPKKPNGALTYMKNTVGGSEDETEVDVTEYNDTGEICKFSHSNREAEAQYRSHQLKNISGLVTCPVLRSFVCPICKATGDFDHTQRYCPRKKDSQFPSGASLTELKKKKNAAGNFPNMKRMTWPIPSYPKEDQLNTINMRWGTSMLTDSMFINDMLTDSIPTDLKGDLKANPTADHTTPKKIKHKHRKVELAVLKYYKVDVTTMDNAPRDASKTKDEGETYTKSTNDGDASEKHDDGEVYEKQDKGEVITTEEIADKTPDDGKTTQIPNEVEVNKTEEIADNTPADVDVNEKPNEGGVDKTTGGGEAAETPTAKSAPAKAAPKAAAKMEESSSGEDSGDEEEAKPAAKEPAAKPADNKKESSDEDSIVTPMMRNMH